LKAIPEPVAVTKPPHHTSGNVAHASAQAQRWGQRDGCDAAVDDIRLIGWKYRSHAKAQRRKEMQLMLSLPLRLRAFA
jgi:hypothetical protein